MEQHVKARIRVECERCGVQQLPALAVTLRCCENDGETTVRYACSRCDLIHVQPTTRAQASALAACVDVRFESWRNPSEPRPSDSGGSFTESHISRWAALLSDDDALERAMSPLKIPTPDTR